MSAKDIIKHFKNAPWKSTDDLNNFYSLVASFGGVDSRVLSGLLDILCNRKISANAYSHELRISAFKRLASANRDKKLFSSYIKAIKNGDSKVVAMVAELMPQVNDIKEHPKLCVLLKSPNADVRRAVSQVISKVGSQVILTTLTKFIREKDFKGRKEAMDAVIPVAMNHGIPMLQAVLEHGNPDEKVKALKYLENKNVIAKAKPLALRAISTVLSDPSNIVQVQAILSFGAMCTENAFFEHLSQYLDSENVNISKAIVHVLGNFDSPSIIASLEKKLHAGPNAVRMEVLASLERIGSDEVLPPLVVALGHKQIIVRKKAGDMLFRLSKEGKLDVARVIIWLLRSTDVNVRRIAVEVARSVKDPDGELWPKLLDFLRDEDWWVRERVMDALVELAGKKLTPHMVEYLKDPHDVIRRFAVDVLERLADPNSLGALVRTAKQDKDWWVKEKAVDAIAKLSDQRAIPYLVDLMQKDEDVKFVCINALRALRAKAAIPYIAQNLDSKNPDLRAIAIDTLAVLDARESVAKIKSMLLDKDKYVARKAREVLMRWNLTVDTASSTRDEKAISFLDKMLNTVSEAEADDLIISSGEKPHMKRLGKTVPISETSLSREQVAALLTPQLTLAQVEELGKNNDVDFSYELKGSQKRFRVNIFKQQGGMAGVFRIIKDEVPNLEHLGLPEVVKNFGELKYGLVLVGGPTGSGKSTTLAALIDHINKTSKRHVISLEDPIEVVHSSQMGLVNQREVGSHTKSFANALRSTLREDPDVILVGEMRDLDTISFAITAAETGHLVFGTVHTVSADTSIDRMINAFPTNEQVQVRSTLADNLRAVVCQYLLKRIDKSGRILATEVMINNDAVANLIRKGKTYQIPSVIATSRDIDMQLMDNELKQLYKQGKISAQDAYMKANAKNDFEDMVQEIAESTQPLDEMTSIPKLSDTRGDSSFEARNTADDGKDNAGANWRR